MKKLFQISLLFLFISSAVAQESNPQDEPPRQTQKILHDYDWKDLAARQALPGEVISTNGYSVLKIVSTNDLLQTFTLLKISDPSVIKRMYFVLCALRYENVSGNNPSFLWLVNFVPSSVLGGDERKLGDSTRIFGTSDWRSCQFRVRRSELGGLPTQLEMQLVMQGRGTVYLRPITVIGVISNWWTPEQAGAIGGIGGSIIGCFGALIGLLVSKGKARKFVLASIKILIALGIIFLVAGLVAVILKQPSTVYYPLLLMGFIMMLVFSLNLPSIQRRYDELEIRRMTSVDTMGS